MIGRQVFIVMAYRFEMEAKVDHIRDFLAWITTICVRAGLPLFSCPPRILCDRLFIPQLGDIAG